ncbi:Hypothetical Protein FCC1311_019342 [Hondaea fermentalgiana]|uniref:VWFA domain-containing protein n=1 Tax=Hondaea fermentalgiana TaxID=2315210 RepID=A0A2R5G599_9STRA|nr:Hypothetical Protein FCC1311_019342 [Hondaea fermentalgiana]|eukprot:GBG25715.1 Hypothetical Protein FCC1311_019342 [Hondaea fermentalgiana]
MRNALRALRFLVQQLCAQDLKPEKPEQDQNTDDDECAVEGDRLAIVSFSDNACVQMPLTRMDARGKAKAEAAIAKTRAFGGTNLSAGVFRGLDLIESRKRGNQRLASVLVLTDGLANRGVLDASRVAAGVKAALQRINTPTSLFAFGIGSTHDADGLVEMTRASAGGVYAYLSGAEMIPHTLEKCLGGLVSVVAQNVRLHFNPRLWTPLAPWRAQQPGMLSVGDMYMSEEKHLVLVRRADAPPSSQHASSLSSSPEGPTAAGVDPAENVYIEYLDVATMAPQTVCTRARPPPTHNDANRAVMQVASICNLALALQAMNSVAAGPSMMQSLSARDAKPAPSVLDTSLAAIRASTAFTSGDPVSGSLVDHLEALLSQENANDPGRRHALLSLSNQYEAQRVLSTSFTAGAGATPGNQRRLPEDDSCEDASSSGPAAVAASTAASAAAAAAAADLAQHRCPQAQTLPVAIAIPSCEMAAALDAVSGYASSSRTLAHGDLGPRASELSFSLDRSSRTALPLMADLGIELPMARTVQRDETDAFTTSTAGRDDRVGSVRTSASSASADSEVSTVSTTSSTFAHMRPLPSLNR